MLKISLGAAVLIALAPMAWADAVGFRTVGVGGEGPRPLNVALWYPAEDTGPEQVLGETPAFAGVRAIPGARTRRGKRRQRSMGQS